MQTNSQTYSGVVESSFETDDATSPTTAESKIDPSKYKTKICRNFANGVPCPFEGRCVFAHGDTQLRRSDSAPDLAAVAAAPAPTPSPTLLPPPPPPPPASVMNRPAPPYSLAIQDVMPPPPYTATYVSAPVTPTTPHSAVFSPVMMASPSVASLPRAGSCHSLPISRPDTPPAYPTHFRHEPYTSTNGYIYCEAPGRTIEVA